MHRFEGRSTVYSWLTRIAINSALGLLRRRRSRSEFCFDPQPSDQAKAPSVEVADSSPNPEQLFDLSQRRLILIRAVKELDACLRSPIQMRLESEFSLKQIGERLGISEGAVKARLYRARAQLSTRV
jgi:RNA polymerase sigma-70 factor (ECF subfamily)